MLSMLSLFTTLVLAQPQEWSWSVFPMAGFKILSPVTLMHDVTEVPTATDKIEYHQFHGGSLADTTMGLAFVIDHYIFPSHDQDPDPEYLRDFFENTIDEILTAVGGSLVYMDFIRQPGQDICIWKASSQHGAVIIRGHCILSGDAYYGLQVFGWKKDQPDEIMSKFLESFKRIDNDSMPKK